ncbi:MAG: GFA family protein [Rhodospirillaceae bacterium]
MIRGTCLCNAVEWSFEGVPDGATACNCTACRRYGALWAYGYEEEGIEVSGRTRAFVRGEAVEFHFCPACGCVSYWRAQTVDDRGRRRIAVNLRLADPALIADIPLDHFDGRDTFDDLPRDGRCVKDMWF